MSGDPGHPLRYAANDSLLFTEHPLLERPAAAMAAGFDAGVTPPTSKEHLVTTIGFIGLGIMGSPMAANLVRAGFDVVGHNRSTAAMERLVAAGGRAAGSVAAAVADADVVATMLPDTPDVVALLEGPDGVLASARPATVLVDFSTIRPDVAVRLSGAAAERGLGLLDAPVSGGEAAAVEGTLSVMVGGDAAHVATARPVFEAVGRTVVHVGAAGAGQTVKAANQLIVAGTLELVAEALVFLDAHGVDPEAAVEVLSGGLAGSTVLTRKAGAMLNRDFKPGFRVELHHKDLGIVTAAAREAGVAIPLGTLVAQLMGSLQASGHGGLDHSALFQLVEQLSGRTPAAG